MARKKILWFCSWYPDRLQPFNGDFVQRHAQAAALFNDIYVIHVAGDPFGTEKISETLTRPAEGLTEHLVYFKRTHALGGKFINYYRWTSAYKKAIREYVRTHGLPDLVHVHVPYRDGLFAMKFKKKYGIPYVVTEHWTIYQPGNTIDYKDQGSLTRSLIYWIIKSSRMLLPVSRDLGTRISQLVVEKEFTVIENVADENLFHCTAQKEGQDGFTFIHVSNMSYQKNTEGLLECFISFYKTNPATRLVLVGPVSETVQVAVKNSGILGSGILLRGEISYPEVASEIKKAQALVLFSRYENSPCSIIEALCCGIPVIATRVGGIPELINDTNGLLVNPGDGADLEKSFGVMVAHYSSYDRLKISTEARSRFSYSTVGKKLDEAYDKAIG